MPKYGIIVSQGATLVYSSAAEKSGHKIWIKLSKISCSMLFCQCRSALALKTRMYLAFYSYKMYLIVQSSLGWSEFTVICYM